ncbi:Na+/H+ antiporter [Paenibacillus koleovorans]|uniref:Na+/H+ antiporter n=1 Tax=Paenibacillus koleovorans TaxID=121608 RepID=UPI000FDAC5EE|nr:Na+/H+ antiporter [Paenibacillus koleovorans]
MEVFIIVLILLALIGLSNVVHRFIPFIPVPLIQIALGALLVIAPIGLHLHMEPELFFLLFIAPLLYNDGMHAPRGELWRLRVPILLLALGLVFATVCIVGYSVHWLIPSIPLAAAFGLAAILSPTDAVAVSSLSKRIHLPARMKQLLEGEALMNDASGLVAFKFAIAAMVTGYFSLTAASWSFVVIAVGGLVVGAVMAVLITIVRKLLRRAGLEDETMHMLLQILTPFLIYLIAEEVGVSGILAAVAGGLLHAVENERMAFTMPNLKNVSDPTWSVILFILNGLVFVLLGLQIPDVSRTVFVNPAIDNGSAIGFAILIYVMLLALRFVWTLLFSSGGRWFGNAEQKRPSFRMLMLTSLSGVRGAITLAAAFSIPLFLENGDPFPQRDLILFLASSVILISLLAASIFLPLLAKKTSASDTAEKERLERAWQLEVMASAVKILQNATTEENEAAVNSVIGDYKLMMQQLAQRGGSMRSLMQARRDDAEVRLLALNIERNYVNNRLESGQIGREEADSYLSMLEQLELLLANRTSVGKIMVKSIWRRLKKGASMLTARSKSALSASEPDRSELRALKMQCTQAVVNELSARCEQVRDEAAEGVLDHYRHMLDRLRRFTLGSQRRDQEFVEHRRELHWIAVQAERDAVQKLFEQGDISRELAAILRRMIRNREASQIELYEMS